MNNAKAQGTEKNRQKTGRGGEKNREKEKKGGRMSCSGDMRRWRYKWRRENGGVARRELIDSLSCW